MKLIIEIPKSTIQYASIFKVTKLSIYNIAGHTSINRSYDCTFILIILLGAKDMISFLLIPLKLVWKSISLPQKYHDLWSFFQYIHRTDQQVRIVCILISNFLFILIHGHNCITLTISNLSYPFFRVSSMQKLIKLSSSIPKGLGIRNGLTW